MKNYSPLQRERLNYKLDLPTLLQNIQNISFNKENTFSIDEVIQKLFPLTSSQSLLSFHPLKDSANIQHQPLNVGILFSGGQAPGGHNVIAGVFDAIKKLNPQSSLIGFLHGFKGLLTNQFISLNQDVVDSYRNLGGFDMIGSERTKLETDEQLLTVEHHLAENHLDGLVIIGGDDSNTNAAFLAEFCKKQGNSISIVGVPKTIDGDLKNDWIETSFGFDTASKVYSEMVGNLLIDSLSAKKYYFFVRLMGRSASHITLECALQTQANLSLIGEEIGESCLQLKDIVNQIADLICFRASLDKHYGMILIPEGLLEFIPECSQLLSELNKILGKNHLQENQSIEFIKGELSKPSLECFDFFPLSIQQQLLLDRDSHGNVQLAKIETERLLILLVEKELEARRLKNQYKGLFSPVPLYFGYEGRSGLPTNFDCSYCYSLGYVAASLIENKQTGYLACLRHLDKPIEEWEPWGIPLTQMLQMEKRGVINRGVIKKTLVDLKGSAFLKFKEKRKSWEIEDDYLCPGPIQFGEKSGEKSCLIPPISLMLEKNRK